MYVADQTIDDEPPDLTYCEVCVSLWSVVSLAQCMYVEHELPNVYRCVVITVENMSSFFVMGVTRGECIA